MDARCTQVGNVFRTIRETQNTEKSPVLRVKKFQLSIRGRRLLLLNCEVENVYLNCAFFGLSAFVHSCLPLCFSLVPFVLSRLLQPLQFCAVFHVKNTVFFPVFHRSLDTCTTHEALLLILTTNRNL